MTKNILELNEQTLSVIEEIGGHMPGGFFIYQAETPEKLIYANKAVFKIYGCSDLEEFRQYSGFTFKGMVHPEDYQKISDSIVQQIDTSADRMDYAEYRIIRKDGAVRWVDDYGHYAETKTYGLIVDEMLAIRSEIDAWREKKASEEANARYNEMLYYGLTEDDE